MKTVIIEDEKVMARSLAQLIREVAPDITIEAMLESIEDSVEWFRHHDTPDVAFMDIHLADGPSFSIFDEITLNCPIIFTTAYDQYALQAFEVNSIDYLLKPIDKSDLVKSIQKLRRLTPNITMDKDIIDQMIERLYLKEPAPAYKSYFLFPEKDKLIPVKVKDIAYIYMDTKLVKAVTFQNKTYYADQSLDEISNQLDPKDFFRANRQFIIAKAAISDLTLWFGNRLSVNLTIPSPERIVVSRAKIKDFKKWFTGTYEN